MVVSLLFFLFMNSAFERCEHKVYTLTAFLLYLCALSLLLPFSKPQEIWTVQHRLRFLRGLTPLPQLYN